MITEASTHFVWQSNNVPPFGIGPIAPNWRADKQPFTPKARHGGSGIYEGMCNVAFLDGHAKSHKITHLQFEGGYDVLLTMMNRNVLPNYYLWVPTA